MPQRFLSRKLKNKNQLLLEENLNMNELERVKSVENFKNYIEIVIIYSKSL